LRIAYPRANWLVPPGPVTRGLRIGLLGGSFNPAHEGHLHVSAAGLKSLGLDYVWWLVAPQNPLKPTAGMAPLDDRVAAARALVRDPRIRVTDIEAGLGTRYTIDTLTALKRRFPGARFVWLMGSDNLESFSRWRRWADIAQLVPIAVVLRPGATLAPLRAKAVQRFALARLKFTRSIATASPPAFAIVDGPRSLESSTAIRGKSVSDEAVVRASPA
jgi:nicotinate-nucleotide adenylyltransferase